MCGIAGAVNGDGRPVTQETLRAMGDVMWYRGPDDTGIWVGGNAGLVHRRLSIIDLSPSGHQPMSSPDGRYHIVFNGEIFNFVELRNELLESGETFSSASDTEVLLKLWQREQDACLSKLVGMYGFAVWDSINRTLFAARDRAGIKPVHFALAGSTLVFASEIKAILAHPDIRPRLDPRGVSDLMFSGYPLEDRTLLKGVHSLAPGHQLTFSGGSLQTRPYWGVEYRYNSTRNFDDTVAELRHLLDDSVRVHCRSDAPIGAHLSGGLDSSAIVALAAQYRPSLPTFSIRFKEGAGYDESVYARAVARHIGSRHHEYQPSPLALESLLLFLCYHIEMPASDTAVAYLNAARLARSHVTVSLTGHGGDEVFGGYSAQFEVGLGVSGDARLGSSTSVRPRSAWEQLAFLLQSEGIHGLSDRLWSRLSGSRGAGHTPSDRWVMHHCRLPEAGNLPSLTAEFRLSLGGYSPREPFLDAFDNAPTDELFDRCLHHDLRTYLPKLLHVEDRTSMAVSLESRVPLLDHRLIEFAATVPPRVKVPDRRTKQLLRAAVVDKVPREVLERRDKGAFPVPVAEWTEGPFMEYARKLLLSDRTLGRGIFTARWIRACVEHQSDIFSMVAFELWCRLFLDQDRELINRARNYGELIRQPVSAGN